MARLPSELPMRTISSWATFGGPRQGGCSNVTGYLNLVVSNTVTKAGSGLTSVVNFTAQVPTVFLNVIGYQTMNISGGSKSSAAMSTYLDFYLTLDVSGSMGLPSTTAEALRMQAINPDNFVQYPTGCTLSGSCHFARRKTAPASMIPMLLPPTITPSILQPRPLPVYPALQYEQLLHGLYLFAP